MSEDVNKKDLKRSDNKTSADKAKDDKATKKESASAKPVKKKVSVGAKFVKYLRELKGEFKKITWPTRSAVTRNTLVTLAACAVVGLVVSLVDLGLGAIIELII